ncbi:non-ribosomal peptide synthetase [Embleya scabrispora]|nr:non-ribosomal peptide synthetase [Embleya scabrispora]
MNGAGAADGRIGSAAGRSGGRDGAVAAGWRAAVAGAWRGGLGCGADGASVRDDADFFAEGGDSVAAVETAIALRELTGSDDLALDILYEHPEFGRLLAALGDGCVAPGQDEFRELTPAEEHLWEAEQRHPGTPIHHIDAHYRFARSPNVPRLIAALDEVAGRYAALQRGFAAPGRAFEVSGVSVPVRWVDAQGVPDAVVRTLLDDEIRTPFELAHPPLLRALVVDRGEVGAELLITAHQLVCDVASLALLEGELQRRYAGAPDPVGRTNPYGPASASLVARPAAPSAADSAAALASWRATLAGCPRAIALPHDLPRPGTLDVAGGVHRMVVPARASAALHAVAAGERLSPFMTWVAGYLVGLAAVTGERDLVVAVPVSTRRPEQRDEVGAFVDTLPLRLTLTPGLTARALARRVRRVVAEALARRHVPFRRIVAALPPAPGEHSRAPLTQVGLTYLDTSERGLRLGRSWAGRTSMPTGGTKYELLWAVTRRGDRTIAELEYRTGLFSEQAAADLHARMMTAIETAFADPDVELPLPAGVLPRRTARRRAMGERAARIEAVPPRAVDAIGLGPDVEAGKAPRGQTFGLAAGFVEARRMASPVVEDAEYVPVHELVRRHARERPDAIAIRHRERELTYRELDEQAAEVAAGLRAAGLRRGAVVAVPIGRGADLVIACLGVLHAGCAYLPVDVRQPTARTRSIVRATAQAALVADETTAALVADLVPVLCLELLAERRRSGARTAPSATPPRVHGDDIAYVMSTSGSTGTPKAVMVPHRAISRLVPHAEYLRIGVEDRVAQLCNPAFDASTFEIWGALSGGATLVIEDADVVLSPTRLRAFLAEQRITVLWLTTTLLNQVIDVAPDALGRLRVLLAGGEPHDPRRLEKLFAGGRPPARVVNGYGPTENTTFSTTHDITPDDLRAGVVPIGRPFGDGTAYALDSRGLPVAAGEEGELYVGGEGLAHGYLNAPAATAAAFVPDPFDPRGGRRLYRTGDRVRQLPCGSFQFLGRRDHQVKAKGVRVELGEVEAVVRRQPTVADTVVFGRPTDNGTEIVACVTPAPDPAVIGAGGGGAAVTVPALDVAALGERLRLELPEYMLPTLVPLDRIPIDADGKVDRAALEAAARPTPEAPRRANLTTPQVLVTNDVKW